MIYRDSVSGIKDTSIIDEIYHSKCLCEGKKSNRAKELIIDCYYTYTYTPQFGEPFQLRITINDKNSAHGFNTNYGVGGGLSLVYDPIKKIWTTSPEFINAINVGGEIYQDVLYHQENSSYYKDLYFSKNKGLIKKVSNQGHVFELTEIIIK